MVYGIPDIKNLRTLLIWLINILNGNILIRYHKVSYTIINTGRHNKNAKSHHNLVFNSKN